MNRATDANGYYCFITLKSLIIDTMQTDNKILKISAAFTSFGYFLTSRITEWV